MPVRTRARWSGFAWVCFVGIVFAASLASPLTAAKRIRVVGVHKGDQGRVEALLQPLRRQPWKLINGDALISAVRDEPSVADARYEANLFGSGILTVSYRVPVARVASRPNLLMDRDGQLFAGTTILSGLPTINLQESVLNGLPTVTHGYDLSGTALTCRLLRDRLPNFGWTVELDPRSVIFLTSQSGTRVILGPPEKLEAKIDKLSAIYASSPAFAKVKEINLVVPGQAVFTP
jgi:hypothetical protein